MSEIEFVKFFFEVAFFSVPVGTFLGLISIRFN